MIGQIYNSIKRKIRIRFPEGNQFKWNDFRKRRRYYIIRRLPPGAGFFSNYMYVLGHIYYAKKHGWNPVIDMENYETLYKEKNALCIEGELVNNAWLYYYFQPERNSLEEAYKSKNYILSSYYYLNEYLPIREKENLYLINAKKLEKIFPIVKEYMVCKNYINKDVDRLVEKYKFSDNYVVGVHIRGTDKKNYHEGHYISANIKKYTDTLNDIMQKKKVDRIFLCTDETEILEEFKKKFPDWLVYNENYRAKSNTNEGIHLESVNNIRENHKYLLGYEVLIDMLMLSKCDELIFGHSNVINAAIICNNNCYMGLHLIGS